MHGFFIQLWETGSRRCNNPAFNEPGTDISATQLIGLSRDSVLSKTKAETKEEELKPTEAHTNV